MTAPDGRAGGHDWHGRFVGPDADGLRELTLHAMAASDRDAHLHAIRARGEGCAPDWMRFAERNDVAPVVAHALLDAFPGGFPGVEAARATHEAALRRMRVLLRELDGVAARLDQADIRMVALKNAGIARGIYPCAGCCPMGDLDVLVERDRFLEAHQLVLECGFEFDSRSIVEPAELEHALASGGAEYVKRVDGEEVWFELQFRAVAGRWIRRDQEPKTSDLMRRSVAIPGTKVRLLEPTDNLLQVALHTAKHSYVRAPGLRLHTDVDRLTVFAPPDWDELVRRARQLHVRTAVFFSLLLARELLGTPIPEAAIEGLRPPGWKVETLGRWLAQIDVFEPNERKFSRPGMFAFHALLYDNWRELAVSAMDAERGELRIGQLPRQLVRGGRRVIDLATRYQP